MKKKKKVVIYGYNMEMGGAEVALINVINLIKDKCHIDLVLLEKKGILMDSIPKEVNVIEIKTNLVKYALFRFIPYFRKIIINKIAEMKYDLGIAFMEGRAATFLADLDQDCKKIAWIHNDVNKFDIGIKEKEIIDSYNKVDKIVAVSIQSQENFCKKYNFTEDKVTVIYNLIDEEAILKKSLEFEPEKKEFTFVNVAKMRPQKRHDRLLQAVKTLKEEGYNFKLWLIGNGPLEEEVKSMVKEYEIEDYVDLLGLKSNPFPYIKQADYFVMSSDHEGYPLSLLEALLLKTKIITTDVSGAREMLGDNKYGYIVDISLEALTDKMREVIKDKKEYKKIDKNLKTYKGSNENIKKQLLEIFDMNK